MKKLLSILLALVLATGLFAACSGSGSGSQAAGSTASGSGAAAAPDGKKTDLLLWLPPFAAGDDGALDKEFWTETLAPWAAENNVDLTIEITPWGNYEEKYLTGFSSGEGPDVGYMYLEMFNDFIEMGALEPLDAYITDADRENYLYLDKGFIKGKQYTMPFIVGNARILYFNMDILEQAGVTELPATWQDLVDVAVKIKEAGLPGVMPFAGEWADPAIGALNNLYYPYLWQAGGDIYNEDGTKVALMDNDAAVKAARFLYDLKFKYGVLPEESMALVGTEVRNQFIEGNIAIASMDAKSGTVLTDAGVNWDFIPSLEDETRATWIASDALIMNSASQNKELAASLIKYITSAEVMAKFHTEIAPFPPITRDEAYNDDERFKEMYEDAEHLHTLPVANGGTGVTTDAAIALKSYPVGALYVSFSATSPASLFGGTWAQITGRFLRAASGTGTGGSDTCTLTSGQMPNHHHGVISERDGDWMGLWQSNVSEGGLWWVVSNSTPGANKGIKTTSVGSDSSHNNMPAYQDVYVWRRTA